MVKKTELLVCLLLTTFMVTVKGNTNSTSVNITSNGASINYPSTLIPLNASTIGKAIFPKLEIKRERDVGQEDETEPPAEEEEKSSENPPDEDDNDNNQREDDPVNETSSAIPASSSIATSLPLNSTAVPTDESDIPESSVGTGSDHTDDTTPNETEEPGTTKDPGAKEGSAVCFKPALVYFLLLPLCITEKVRLLW